MTNLNSLKDHHREVLEYMNEERKKQSLCDIKLVVRGDVVHAHKCVLAAESEYFRILFHSQFSDSNKNEYDLTPAVKNASDLEHIVNFIYTSQIEITSKNFPDLARLASFFLMKNLRLKIKDCILKHLYKETCLSFYLWANQERLTDIEGMAAKMLKARFHDYVIYRDETLEILTPDALEHFEEKGFLKFCEMTQLMDFIAKWVGRHPTESHVTVACAVMAALMERSDACISHNTPITCTKKQVKKSLKMMMSNLKDAGLNPEDNRMVANFVSTFKKAFVGKAGDGKSSSGDGKSLSGNGKSSSGKGKRGKTKTTDQNELVLVALGKLRDGCDDEDDDDEEHDDDDSDTDSLFIGEPLHVCIYVPSSQCWFKYCSVPVESIAFTSDFYKEKNGEFFMLSDHILTYSHEKNSLLYYQHKRNPKETVTKKTEVDFDRFNPSVLDSFVTVHNDNVYVVHRFLDEETLNDEDIFKNHFIGYRLSNERKLIKLFATEPVIVPEGRDKDFSPVRDVQIGISSRSNEMLIIYTTVDEGDPDCTIVYLVKLRARNCPIKVLLNTKDKIKLLRGCRIVEMDDRFLIVREDSDKTKVLCEYVFRSEQITYDTGYTPGKLLGDSSTAKDSSDTLIINGTHHLWHIEVYMQRMSILKSADFSEKKIMVTEHVSPPLTQIFSAHETTLPKSFLKTLKKVC